MENNQNINVWSYLEEYNEYEKDLEKIVNEVFKSGRLILGEKVSEFENNLRPISFNEFFSLSL